MYIGLLIFMHYKSWIEGNFYKLKLTIQILEINTITLKK